MFFNELLYPDSGLSDDDIPEFVQTFVYYLLSTISFFYFKDLKNK